MKACDLYPRTGRGAGEREYWVGYLGGLKVLVFKYHNPTEDGPTHAMFLTARPPKQEPKRIATDPIPDGGDEIPF